MYFTSYRGKRKEWRNDSYYTTNIRKRLAETTGLRSFYKMMKKQNNVMNKSIEISFQNNKSDKKDMKMLTSMDIVLTILLFILMEVTLLSMFSIQNIKVL